MKLLPQKRWKKIIVIAIPLIIVLGLAGLFITNYLSNVEPSFAAGASSNPLVVSSSAFSNLGAMPVKSTGDGENINPPLQVTGVPGDAVSLVVIMDDPSVPLMTWNHWVVWNLPAHQTVTIEENSMLGVTGKNSWRSNSYGGPDPPFGSHTYTFKVYALDQNLSIDSNAGKTDVLNAMNGHVLAKGELSGVYP
ncbi:MAG TPA: YbhB/YbcL family Raf kinase inhibitor-like protein [Candidatus Acidoferrales bacterium]|nr:YbhB/YbcL family Raf kinase inhibitor-like protein [Candidatus Acidoferrales bacterium]